MHTSAQMSFVNNYLQNSIDLSFTTGYFCVGGVAGWWRGTVVERRSLTGELSLSCAQPAADG